MILPITQGEVCLIDLQDLVRLAGKPCSLAGRGKHRKYVQFAGPKGTPILLHRFIMRAPKGVEVHHINGNGLDNRRANLRLVTRQQNAAGFQRKRSGSKSRFRGVTWWERDQNWMARIVVNYREIYLGYFDLEEDAARAYNAAAKEHFGDFAHLNIL